jgi:hypothetical protein
MHDGKTGCHLRCEQKIVCTNRIQIYRKNFTCERKYTLPFFVLPKTNILDQSNKAKKQQHPSPLFPP